MLPNHPNDNRAQIADTTPVYVISAAAELSGLHPQTLRQYDRLGLVCPDRAPGRGRRYSLRDIELLREVQRLSQDEGVNLAGIKRIRELQDQVAVLSAQVAELEERLAMTAATTIPVALPVQPPTLPPNPLHRPDLLPALGPSTALVVWKPQH